LSICWPGDVLQDSQARLAGRVELVHLVSLVCFVSLVDWVYLVSFVQPTKQDKPTKPNNGLLRQTACLNILLARIIHECRREAFETEARRGFSQVRPT